MRSNYKKLGEYIREINIRNNDLNAGELLGVSIKKVLIPSIANTVGTNMETYKIIKKNQFAYGPVTSRNGDKISVALLEEYHQAIVSQAYIVFEVINPNELLPEYLMMWFRRPEFDRYARYRSHGSAREIFDWEELCDVDLPVPHINKQREIVKEYDTIENHISVSNQLIQKLEEAAQTLYKHWFVDYEFPDAQGKPYKSNGGEMEDSELGKIPRGWKVGEINDIIDLKNGKLKPASQGTYPVYGGNGIIEYVGDYNFENVIAIGRVGIYCGSLFRVDGKCWISDNAICAKSKYDCNMFAFHLLNNLKLNERSEGTGQPLLTQGVLGSIKIIIPERPVIELFEKYSSAIFLNKMLKSKGAILLRNLSRTLLSKLAVTEKMEPAEII